jgi:putative spermidine/putrescine transport system permease protein
MIDEMETLQEFKPGFGSNIMAKVAKYRMWVLLSPAFLQVFFFFVLPILIFLRISFYPSANLGQYQPGFTLKSYIHFYTDAFYLSTFFFTFKLTVIVTIATLLIGYPVAYLISKSRPMTKAIYLIIILITMWTEYIIKIYGLVIVFSANGLVNSFLRNLGIIDESLDMLYNTFAVAVGLVQVAFPYMVLSLLGVLEKIDPFLKDAARNLGAGRIKTFFTVTLPLSVPGIAAGCIFAALWTLGSYATPALLGAEAQTTIAMRVEHEILNTFNWPFGAAMAFNMLFSIVAVYLFLNQFTKKGRV